MFFLSLCVSMAMNNLVYIYGCFKRSAREILLVFCRGGLTRRPSAISEKRSGLRCIQHTDGSLR